MELVLAQVWYALPGVAGAAGEASGGPGGPWYPLDGQPRGSSFNFECVPWRADGTVANTTRCLASVRLLFDERCSVVRQVRLDAHGVAGGRP